MIFDGHCDTLSVALDENKDIDDLEFSFNLIDCKNLDKSVIQVMAVYVAPKFVKEGTNNAWERANNIIDKFYEQKEKFNQEIVQILKVEDVEKIRFEKKIGVMLSIENGSAICGQIERIKQLYDRGVRVMSITWNEDNDLGCGAQTLNDTGLTKLGEQYIKELEKNHIIIDVSHASEKTFWDVSKIVSNPIIATHSCAYSLCPNSRNLKDEQIKEIARLGGKIGICFYSDFLNSNKQATSEDIIDHIVYISDLVGTEHVFIGSDFDGMEKAKLPFDVKGIKDIKEIKNKLENRGFRKEEINKILGGGIYL